ncbi:MAG: phenylalanine--tRNA ligase subunit alpha, partial [Clostridia bacterium]
MLEQLKQIEINAKNEIAVCGNETELDSIRVKFLGKKGELTAILRGMGKLTAEERPVVGKVANEVREAIESALESKVEAIKAEEKKQKLESEVIDISMPGKKQIVGKNHPITL